MMLCVNLFVIFCIILFISFSDAFGVSPPLTPVVCASLNPFGHWTLDPDENEALDFRITSNKSWFIPNETVTITLSSPSETTFKGLILHVRDKHMRASGRLSFTGDDFQHLGCEYVLSGSSYQGTISHNNSNEKSVAVFSWKAPPSCIDDHYEVAATVVKSRVPNLFQTDIHKKLECRSTLTPLPGSLLDYNMNARPYQCRHQHLTSVPLAKYDTGFESSDFNGWTNTGWLLNDGGTSSLHTGPVTAGEGSNYLYFESSYAPSVRPWASLETDRDLRGCLCLQLQHHRNVDADRKHEFRVIAGDDLLYHTVNKQAYWSNLSLQIDTDDFVKVRIVGYRGDNFRGDMAIDNLVITAGSCSQEEA